jgi:endogenous inhibitor of DNA gyrase (YacG/DUF329 family)
VTSPRRKRALVPSGSAGGDEAPQPLVSRPGGEMRVEEVFAAAGLTIGGEAIPAARIRVVCPNCGRTSGANELRHAQSGAQTSHDCPHCAATVLTVSPAPGRGGYQLKDWIVVPRAGMSVDVPLPGERL